MVSKMASNEDILKEAEYYLNNDVTNEEASKALGISKRSFQLHMKKLAEIAPDKYKLVEDKKTSISRQGNIKGGSLGRRSSSFEEVTISELADYLISGELTYKEAAEQLGVPKSTIHDLTHKSLKNPETSSLLYALAMAHKKGMTLDNFMDERERYSVKNDEQKSNKSK